MPPTPSRSKTSYGPNCSQVGSEAGFIAALNERKTSPDRNLEERQLYLRVIKATVLTELADVSTVDEPTKADVGILCLLVGERVEHVIGADRDEQVLRELIADVDIEQHLGSKFLVVHRVVGPVVDLAVVVAAQ